MSERSEVAKYLDVSVLGQVVEFDVADAESVTLVIGEAACAAATWNTALPVKLRRRQFGPREDFASPVTLTGPGPKSVTFDAEDLAGVVSLVVENGPTAKTGLLLEVACIVQREVLRVRA